MGLQVGLAGPFEYDEGVWTPDLSFAGASVGITYVDRGGIFSRTGNLVIVTGFFNLSSKGVSVGNALIGGLPFRVINDPTGMSAATFGLFPNITFIGQYAGWTIINSFQLALGRTSEAGGVGLLTDVNFANNSGTVMSLVYRTG